jgi:hypothetical protein
LAQTFTTVYNLPPDEVPRGTRFIDSDTQVNLWDGGEFPSNLDIGAPDGSSSNIQVNITGGTVGNSLEVRSGSEVNINGGVIGPSMEVSGDAVINLSGGVIGNQMSLKDTGTVNITGGRIGQWFRPEGGTVNLSGGVIGDGFRTAIDTSVTISGGVFGRSFRILDSSHLTLIGDEFLIEGNAVAGLDAVGDRVELSGLSPSSLTGTLADGSVFILSAVSDRFENVTLIRAAVPTPAAAILNVPTDPAPSGLRPGQTLHLAEGGALGEYFAVASATLDIAGGTVEQGLEVARGRVAISGGQVGDHFDVFDHSKVQITGGLVGDGMRVFADTTVDISGGRFGRGFMGLGGEVTLRGGDFRINGEPVAGLVSPGDRVPFSWHAGTELTGTLADGSVFIFSLDLDDRFYEDVLTLELAPVPGVSAVVNVPSDPMPPGLRPGQTLNLAAGAAGDYFAAVDAVVNVNGGSIGDGLEALNSAVTITDGSIGHNMAIFSGSTLHVAGGSIGDDAYAGPGSRITIDGGSVGQRLYIDEGGTLNLNGGTVGDELYMIDGTLNLAGGHILGDLDVDGGTVNVTGGKIDSYADIHGSTFNMLGGTLDANVSVGNSTFNMWAGTINGGVGIDRDTEFNMWGGSIRGTLSSFRAGPIVIHGGEVGFIDINDGDTIILAGGRVNRLSLGRGGSFEYFAGSIGQLSMRSGHSVHFTGMQLDSITLRGGGGLTPPYALLADADISDYVNASEGSEVRLVDGSVGGKVQAYTGSVVWVDGTAILGGVTMERDARLVLTSGSIGSRVDMYSGSLFTLEDGTVGDGMRAYGSTVQVNGGTLGNQSLVTSGGTLNLADGSVGTDLTLSMSATLNMTGGSIGTRFFIVGASAHLSGGSIEAGMLVMPGSAIEVLGTSFVLDGIVLTPGLVMGESFVITSRDVTLSGLFADGTPFSFELNTTPDFTRDYFHPDAVVTIMLVPEPVTMLLLGFGICAATCRRARPL